MQFGDGFVLMTKGEVKCLLAFASRDAHRPNIHGVIVDHGAQRVGATDGQRGVMCCAPGVDPRGECVSPIIVPRSIFEQAGKFYGCRIVATPTGVAWAGYDRAGFSALKEGRDLGAAVRGDVAGPFPNPAPLHIVIPQPSERPPAEQLFLTTYFADLVLLDGAGVEEVRIRFGGDDWSPCLVRGESDTADWTAVIMPRKEIG